MREEGETESARETREERREASEERREGEKIQ